MLDDLKTVNALRVDIVINRASVEVIVLVIRKRSDRVRPVGLTRNAEILKQLNNPSRDTIS
jgi:hypothetical protein